MSTSSRTARERRSPSPRGPVRALVAAESSPAGRSVLAGELVRFPLPCGRTSCSCTADFSGVVTRGLTDVARVRTFEATSRSDLRRAIAAGMCSDCVPSTLAPTQAERLLRAAAELPDGTLVRRDAVGAIRPFPPGSTISAEGRVSSPDVGLDR